MSEKIKTPEKDSQSEFKEYEQKGLSVEINESSFESFIDKANRFYADTEGKSKSSDLSKKRNEHNKAIGEKFGTGGKLDDGTLRGTFLLDIAIQSMESNGDTKEADSLRDQLYDDRGKLKYKGNEELIDATILRTSSALKDRYDLMKNNTDPSSGKSYLQSTIERNHDSKYGKVRDDKVNKTLDALKLTFESFDKNSIETKYKKKDDFKEFASDKPGVSVLDYFNGGKYQKVENSEGDVEYVSVDKLANSEGDVEYVSVDKLANSEIKSIGEEYLDRREEVLSLGKESLVKSLKGRSTRFNKSKRASQDKNIEDFYDLKNQGAEHKKRQSDYLDKFKTSLESTGKYTDDQIQEKITQRVKALDRLERVKNVHQNNLRELNDIDDYARNHASAAKSGDSGKIEKYREHLIEAKINKDAAEYANTAQFDKKIKDELDDLSAKFAKDGWENFTIETVVKQRKRELEAWKNKSIDDYKNRHREYLKDLDGTRNIEKYLETFKGSLEKKKISKGEIEEKVSEKRKELKNLKELAKDDFEVEVKAGMLEKFADKYNKLSKKKKIALTLGVAAIASTVSFGVGGAATGAVIGATKVGARSFNVFKAYAKNKGDSLDGTIRVDSLKEANKLAEEADKRKSKRNKAVLGSIATGVAGAAIGFGAGKLISGAFETEGIFNKGSYSNIKENISNNLLDAKNGNTGIKGSEITLDDYYKPNEIPKSIEAPGVVEKISTNIDGTSAESIISNSPGYEDKVGAILERYQFATNVDPGQGLFQTFQNMGVSPDKWNVMLNDPVFQEEFIASGRGYIMENGQLGIVGDEDFDLSQMKILAKAAARAGVEF